MADLDSRKAVGPLLSNIGLYGSSSPRKSHVGATLTLVEDMLVRPVQQDLLEKARKIHAIRTNPSHNQAVNVLADFVKNVQSILKDAPKNTTTPAADSDNLEKNSSLSIGRSA